MAKRASLKGRGADIFSPDSTPAEQHTSRPARQRASMPAEESPSLKKATFWLPLGTLDRLESMWIASRKRKVSKSALVNEALDTFLRKQEAAGK